MLHWLEYITVRVLLAALRCIPYPTTLRLARAAAHTAYRFDTTPRARALKNLRLAYGEALGKREAERIARGVFETLSRLIAEGAHVPITMSFLRSRIYKYPSSSNSPMSPVYSQPSRRLCAFSAGRLR